MNTKIFSKKAQWKDRAKTPEEAIQHAKEHENTDQLLEAAKRKILRPYKSKHCRNGRSHTKEWYQKIIDILSI
jgi:hypothetical protein